MMTHSVTVLTSANSSDFDGPVFVSLVCDRGETDEAQLLQYDGTAPIFTAGSPLSITLRTVDLGKVQTVKVIQKTRSTIYLINYNRKSS